MRCSLFDFENQQFGEVWNEETIKELKDFEPVGGTPLRSEPLEYYCWYGKRLPQWFE